MTEQTITFTPAAELRKGVRCLVRGFVLIFLSIGKLLNHAVRKYPWFFIVSVILAASVLSVVFIGKARAERDARNKKNYELQQKLENVKMANEAKEEQAYAYYIN